MVGRFGRFALQMLKLRADFGKPLNIESQFIHSPATLRSDVHNQRLYLPRLYLLLPGKLLNDPSGFPPVVHRLVSQMTNPRGIDAAQRSASQDRPK